MGVSNALRGKRAYNFGQQFENLLQSSAHSQGIICTRIPDGCRQLANKRIIRVKSPFDWVLTCPDKGTALIDTKSCNTTTFQHSGIDLFQATTLLRHELKGTRGGYVVWLRPVDEVIFIPASTLTKGLQTRGSIGITDSIQLGSHQQMDLSRIFDVA